MLMIVKIPKDLAEQIQKLGYDINDFVLQALQEKIGRHLRAKAKKP